MERGLRNFETEHHMVDGGNKRVVARNMMGCEGCRYGGKFSKLVVLRSRVVQPHHI